MGSSQMIWLLSIVRYAKEISSFPGQVLYELNYPHWELKLKHGLHAKREKFKLNDNIFLSLVFIFGLISCQSSIELTDYLGQSYPDSIPVIFAPDIVSMKGRFEHGISFTPDNQELAFGILNKDDFSGEILYSRKVNENWTEPIGFEPLIGESVFLPYFSPDGKSVLFAKSRPDTKNGVTDIWILNKNNDTWKYPEKVNSPISTLMKTG